MNNIFASLLFPKLADSEQLAELFELMGEFKLLTPAKYDYHEPIRREFNCNRVGEIARELFASPTFYWIGIGGIAGGSISTRLGRGKQTGSLSIWTQTDRFEEPSDIATFVQRIASRFGCTYGYAHYLSEAETTVLAGSDCVLGNESNPPVLKVTRFQLVRCLPNLFWANVFGPEYVAMFGRERVITCPVPIVREVSGDTFYIQLSESMLDFATRHTEVNALRQRVKEHLGIGCFFDTHEKVERTYRVPHLGWQEPNRRPMTAEAVQRFLQERRSKKQ